MLDVLSPSHPDGNRRAPFKDSPSAKELIFVRPSGRCWCFFWESTKGGDVFVLCGFLVGFLVVDVWFFSQKSLGKGPQKAKNFPFEFKPVSQKLDV